jgi:malonyl-CoA decarboxylase
MNSPTKTGSAPAGSPSRRERGEDMLGAVSRGARLLWRRIAASVEEMTAPRGSGLGRHSLDRIRAALLACATEQGGEASARARAAQLGATYLALDTAGRQDFLRLLSSDFGPEPQRAAAALARYQASLGGADQPYAELELRTALRSQRGRILRQFNALPEGTKFLVDLRADVLRWLKDDAALGVLDGELQALLQSWFDVGFLALERITWDSPASLLEKLIGYEAVHEIRSWSDLRHRLESDRRCYAFFHPRMPREPLIFVEVALTAGLAGNIQALLDESAPDLDPKRADTAMFYSISNTQVGLRGISFGNFLIKRVVAELQRDLPNLKRYATLSPLPQFGRWLAGQPDAAIDAALGPRERAALEEALGEPCTAQALRDRLAGDWLQQTALAEALRLPLSRLAARYLASARHDDGGAHCPVARFHLANGARLERINPLADLSPKGLRQSAGVMVNYLYRLDYIEENHERYVKDGVVAMSSEVRRLL